MKCKTVASTRRHGFTFFPMKKGWERSEKNWFFERKKFIKREKRNEFVFFFEESLTWRKDEKLVRKSNRRVKKWIHWEIFWEIYILGVVDGHILFYLDRMLVNVQKDFEFLQNKKNQIISKKKRWQSKENKSFRMDTNKLKLCPQRFFIWRRI